MKNVAAATAAKKIDWKRAFNGGWAVTGGVGADTLILRVFSLVLWSRRWSAPWRRLEEVDRIGGSGRFGEGVAPSRDVGHLLRLITLGRKNLSIKIL